MVEKMKPSGIDWIGDIPNEWSVTKVRFVTKLRSEQGFYSSDDKYIGLENISSYTGKYISTESEYDTGTYDLYKAGDLLFSKLRPYLAKALIADDCGFCTGELAVIKEYNGDIRYLFYYMLSDGFLEMVDASTYGAKMPRASWDYIKNLQIPVMRKSEQQAIADFLDKECAQIDSIAADLEKQVTLLQQYKKSLITETVTKGLDKSVPMKDSGVEWTSKIPCYWEIKRFKYLCEYITDGSHFSPETTDEGYPYITAADVKGVGLDYDAAKKISQQDFIFLQKAGCQPRKSDVLLVKDGATTGRIGMVTSEKPCVVLSSVAILRAPDNMDARYLRYLMESDFVQAQIQASMAGSAMPRTVLSKIINYWGITCPKEEQKEICDFLDRKCGYIETVIETKQVQQSTIQQHKKSLIYEYVTGKKRVKEVQ